MNQTIMSISSEAKWDKRLSIYIACYYIFSSLNIALKIIFRIEGSLGSLLSNLVAGVMILGFLYSFQTIVMRSRFVFVVSEAIALIAYLFSFLFGYALSTSFLINKAMWTLGICIPLGVAAYSVYDKRILIKYLDLASWVSIIPLWCSLLMLNQNDDSYNMASAYALLMPTLMMFYHYFAKKKPLYLIVGLASTVIIVFFGNRGALLCIVLYWLVKAIVLNSKPISKFLYCILLVTIFYFVVINQSAFINILETVIDRFGIKSYLLSNYINNSFFTSSSRDFLWETYFQKVLEKPFWGWGVGGGWVSAELYPHDIFLELFVSFGIIFGTVFSLLFIGAYIKAFTCKIHLNRELLIIYAVCCASIFVSASFLNTPKVFMFAFLCLGCNKAIPAEKDSALIPAKKEKS